MATHERQNNLKVTFLDDKVEEVTTGQDTGIKFPTDNWDYLSSYSMSQESVITPVGSLAHSSCDSCSTPRAVTTPEHYTRTIDPSLQRTPIEHNWEALQKSRRDRENSPASSHSSSIDASNSCSSHGYQGRVQVPSLTDVRSSVTTASELDFRRELATLDADIARLQVQFKVALQPS